LFSTHNLVLSSSVHHFDAYNGDKILPNLPDPLELLQSETYASRRQTPQPPRADLYTSYSASNSRQQTPFPSYTPQMDPKSLSYAPDYNQYTSPNNGYSRGAHYGGAESNYSGLPYHQDHVQINKPHLDTSNQYPSYNGVNMRPAVDFQRDLSTQTHQSIPKPAGFEGEPRIKSKRTYLENRIISFMNPHCKHQTSSCRHHPPQNTYP